MHFIRKLRLLKVEGRDWGLPWHMGGPIAPSLFTFARLFLSIASLLQTSLSNPQSARDAGIPYDDSFVLCFNWCPPPLR